MRLDELKAAADRMLADHAKCGNGNHASARCVDALALATFVRDLFALEPTDRVEPHRYNARGREPRVIQTIGNIEYVFDAEYAVRLAADLLRAAEQAEVGASQAVHLGSPGDDTGRGT